MTNVKSTFYQVGDYIQFKKSSVVKEIVEVRDTGYTLRYPDGSVLLLTDNEVDPFLEDGWHIKYNE